MKRGLIVIAVLLVGLVAVGPFAAAQGNLVQNPGFETWQSDYPHFPSGGAWALGGDTSFIEIGKRLDALPPIGMSAIPVYQQDYAAQMGNTGEGTLSQTVNVTAGQKYQFSFALWAGDAGGSNSFKADVGGNTAFFQTAFDTGGAWDLKTYSFVPTSDTAEIKFTSSSVDYFYVDAVSLVPIPEPTTIAGLASLGLLGGAAFWWRRRQRRDSPRREETGYWEDDE